MPFEDEFSHALRQAADDAPPPEVGVMAVGAQRRGERRRRRRTIVVGAAAVALVAGAGAVASQLRPSTTAVSAAAPTGASVTASASAKAETSPAPTTPGPGRVKSVTAAQMLLLFHARLPAGLALSDPISEGADTPQRGPVPVALAGYTVTDARGTGGVEITVSRGRAGDPAASGLCPPQTSGAPTCTGTAQPDGSYLWVNRQPRAAGGEQVWEVTLVKADGTRVMVSSGNLPGPGPGANVPGPTRDAPVLDTPQLSAIALDPMWQQVSADPGGPPA